MCIFFSWNNSLYSMHNSSLLLYSLNILKVANDKELCNSKTAIQINNSDCLPVPDSFSLHIFPPFECLCIVNLTVFIF